MKQIIELKKLLEGAKVSRKVVLSYLDEIQKEYDDTAKALHANLAELSRAEEDFDTQMSSIESELIKGDNLAEQEIVDTFAERLEMSRKGQLNLNQVLNDGN